MDFRDEIEIDVRAGKGGDGLVSFRREKYVPKGGPDGGDGGRGGDVVFVASPHVRSLLGLGRRPRYEARSGQPGGPKGMTGRAGEDLVLEVPTGTQVKDRARGNLLRDLSTDGERFVVAQGGAGGRGNTHFASSTRQVPRKATPGGAGEELELRLELKLFAEVGLVGLPNAGKSTFLSAVTAARPKIADYPFTTLAPQVGIAAVRDFETLVIADLPGLIEGASEGRGLGHRFLKHVERCGVLLQLVDCSSAADTEPLDAFRAIDGELSSSSPELAAKERIVCASKCEEPAAEERAAELEAAIGRPVRRISAQTGAGVAELLDALCARVRGDADA